MRVVIVIMAILLVSCSVNRGAVEANPFTILIIDDNLIEISRQDSTFYVPLAQLDSDDQSGVFIKDSKSYLYGQIDSDAKVGPWKHYTKRKGVYQIDCYPLHDHGSQAILRTEWYHNGRLYKSAIGFPDI